MCSFLNNNLLSQSLFLNNIYQEIKIFDGFSMKIKNILQIKSKNKSFKNQDFKRSMNEMINRLLSSIQNLIKIKNHNVFSS